MAVHTGSEPLLLAYGRPSRAAHLAKSLARGALKLAMWALFLAWIAVFFVIPTEFGTDFYTDWEDATGGTLYGTPGSLPELCFCGENRLSRTRR